MGVFQHPAQENMMEGKAWVFGDNVDTDMIFPARFSADATPEEMAKHVFYDFRPEFAREVKPGDIIVGGHNFAYGSYREWPVTGISSLGIRMIIGRSFARAFYRNACNTGIWLITLGDLPFRCDDGNILDADPLSGLIINKSTEERVQGVPLSGIAREIVGAGGATRYFKPKVLYPAANKA